MGLKKQYPELLVPAGNMEKLQTAISYGADAVYLGGASMNLRAQAGGFSFEELGKAISLAHRHGVKVYYLLNALPRQTQLADLYAHFEALASLAENKNAPDALIIADPGVLRLAQKELPDLAIHISTQANTSNSEAAFFWQSLGAKRVNCARELRSHELREMLLACKRMNSSLELEVFVHGAQCMAISGRCYLSSYLNGRSANLGTCTHPCRYEYQARSINVAEKTRETETLWEVRQYWEEFGEQAQGMAEGYSTFFAPHDLCLLHYLEWLAQAGVASVKIEGRTKSSSYLAQVTDVYASALKNLQQANETYSLETALEELVNTATRPLCTGFFDAGKQQIIADPVEQQNARPILGRIVDSSGLDCWLVDVKHRWLTRADKVELLLPGMQRKPLAAEEFGIESEDGKNLLEAHPGQRVLLYCDRPELRSGLFLRRAWLTD